MRSILFPVSFYFNTHNLISELICFVFFVCMDYLGYYQHLVKMSLSTASLEIYFLRKMVTCSIIILPAVYIYTDSLAILLGRAF